MSVRDECGILSIGVPKEGKKPPLGLTYGRFTTVRLSLAGKRPWKEMLETGTEFKWWPDAVKRFRQKSRSLKQVHVKITPIMKRVA